MGPWGGILASMAAEVLAKVIVELPGKLRRLIESEPEKKKALQLAFESGLESALAAQKCCLELANVDINLDTKTRTPVGKAGRKRETKPLEELRDIRPLGALESAITNYSLVLLGDPGSGKSTS